MPCPDVFEHVVAEHPSVVEQAQQLRFEREQAKQQAEQDRHALSQRLAAAQQSQQAKTRALKPKLPQSSGGPVFKHDRGVVQLSDDVEDDCAFLRTNGRLIEVLVNRATWLTIKADSSAMIHFLDDMTREGKAMGIQVLVTDSGYYRDAVVARARQEGTDLPQQPDRLTALRGKLEGLIVQAASLNLSATEGQMVIFSTRYAEAATVLDGLEKEMGRLRDLLGLAATAVVEAA